MKGDHTSENAHVDALSAGRIEYAPAPGQAIDDTDVCLHTTHLLSAGGMTDEFGFFAKDRRDGRRVCKISLEQTQSRTKDDGLP